MSKGRRAQWAKTSRPLGPWETGDILLCPAQYVRYGRAHPEERVWLSWVHFDVITLIVPVSFGPRPECWIDCGVVALIESK